MSCLKSFLIASGQFIIGFFGWAIFLIFFNFFILSVLQKFLPYNDYKNAYTIIRDLFLIGNQVVGLGLAILLFLLKKIRWIGIGIVCVFFLFILGAFLGSGCMPPLLLPFPLSLMSAC